MRVGRWGGAMSDPLTFLVQFICRSSVWFPVLFLYISLPTISAILVGGACFFLLMFDSYFLSPFFEPCTRHVLFRTKKMTGKWQSLIVAGSLHRIE